MQSSDRNVFSSSQSRADSAFHMPRTASSADTCQLTFSKHGHGRSLVRGAQEPAGAPLADEIGRLAVEEHRAAADEYRADGLVVAIHHARQPAVLFDAILGVAVKRRVQPHG